MRSIRYLFVFVIFVSATGCKRNEKIPSSVLSTEKMQLVLEDMMKADQFLSDYLLNRDTTKKRETEGLRVYDQVFAIHKISADKFYKSFQYYKEHPRFLQPILDSLSKPIEAVEIDKVPLETGDTLNTAPAVQPPVDTITPIKVDSSGKKRARVIPVSNL